VTKIIGFLALALLAPFSVDNAATAQTRSPANLSQKSLQIADLGGIEEWRAGGDNLVYIKDDQNQWYKVEMQEACMKLDTKKGISFTTEVGDRSTKYSSVVVGHYECRITSITKIESPPSR